MFDFMRCSPSSRTQLLPLITACALALTGCVAGGHSGGEEGTARVAATEPPAFLTGAPGVLLTNTADYRARITVESKQKQELITGTLFQQAGWLLFVPGAASPARETNSAGVFRFLWDTASRKGYVLSQALQGYAPIASRQHDSPITLDGAVRSTGSERLDGRECTLQEVNVRAGLAQSRFRLWRSEEPNDPPIRIQSLNGEGELTIQLADLEVERLSPELFEIPPRFSKYLDAAAMQRQISYRPPVLPYSHPGQ